MNIITIPTRNIRRKPARYLLLLSVFTLGVISIVALYQVAQVVGESLEKKLTAFGANISIAPRAETLKVNYGGFNLGEMFFELQQLPEQQTVQAIKSIGYKDRISIIAPKLVSMTKINGTPVALVGVRWQQELNLKSYWAVNGAFPTNDNEVVIGVAAAKALKLGVGDSVEIYDNTFTVSGILYETGNDDDTVIFLELSTLQNITNQPNMASFVEVAALCSGCPIDDIVAQIRGVLPDADVKALQNVVNQRMASIKFVQKLAFIVSIIILVTASSMVALSMLSAVNERKKDIGILRSLGFSKARVFLIFCVEGALIGCLAGAIGYIAGYAASFKVLEVLTLADGVAPEFVTLHLFLTSLLFGFITLAAALYPSWKGANTEPSSTLIAL